MLNLQKYPQRIRKTQETSGFHQFDTLKGLVDISKSDEPQNRGGVR
jgi:hypothetical protein